MSKKINIGKPSKRKKSAGDTFINVFVILLFGGIFIWMGINVYLESRSDANSKDAYLASLPAPEDTLDHSKVCMVDNIYLGKGGYPVSISDKIYYGCSQKATRDLAADTSTRLAIDPVSKRKVDKATATITIHPDKNGKVIYFESRETYNKYLEDLKNVKNRSQ